MEFNHKEVIQRENKLKKVLVILGVVLVMLVLGFLVGKGVYAITH